MVCEDKNIGVEEEVESSDEEEELEVVPPPSPARLCNCRIREVWFTVAGETLAPDLPGVSFGSSSGSPQPVPPCMQVPEVIRVSSSDEDEEVEIVPLIGAICTRSEKRPELIMMLLIADFIHAQKEEEEEEKRKRRRIMERKEDKDEEEEDEEKEVEKENMEIKKMDVK